ncbi:hypothetical protein AB0I10_01105 [Streptomyces sp. NPDC050636]
MTAVTVALVVCLVIGVVALNEALEHPDESGMDGWLCAADSGPCDE